MYEEIIGHAIRESIKIKQYVLDDQHLISIIDIVAEEIINAFRHDKKVLLCGNGGSAADAQHLAAELSGRFYIDRPPLFAEALHVNTSYLTAVANDYSFDEVYKLTFGVQNEFKNTAENIYSKNDKENGYMIAKDRFNMERKFNLLSVSSAIIEINSKSNISNFDNTLNILKKASKGSVEPISSVL